MITITETARQKIVQLEEHFSQPVKGLRVSAIPRSPIRASFTMKLIPEGEPESPADIIQSFDEVDVYIDPDSAPYLEAAAIDYVITPMASGFKVVAPPRKLDTPEGMIKMNWRPAEGSQFTASYMRGQHDGGKRYDQLLGGDGNLIADLRNPVPALPKNITIATSSFKYVKLCAGFGSEGTTWIYANPEALVDAAVNGVFKPTARWDYWSQPKEMRLASEIVQPLYDGSLPIFS